MVSVFLDLQKAFDTVDHNLLLVKLYKYGIRGHIHEWLKSYLNKRQQYVQFKQNNSDCQSVICGIPQGSVLGPKLFILFINNVYEVVHNTNILLFADDTTFFKAGNNLDNLIDDVSKDMTMLKKWFNQNKLFLNWDKTKYIIFGNKRSKDYARLVVDEINIEKVSEIKFLGVMLDEKLSWKPHVDYIKKRLVKV